MNSICLTLFSMMSFCLMSACIGPGDAIATVIPLSQVTVLNSGQNGTSQHARNAQIRSQAQYEAELAAISAGTGVAAKVDFTRGSVLLIDMGTRNSGGLALAIASVKVSADKVIANVRLTAPGSNCLTAAVMTNPYQFLYIPTSRNIIVEDTSVVRNC